MRMKRQALGLVGWLTAAFATGGIGAIASIDAASFYATLNTPPWAPPASVFGPVWSALYALMGIAAWLVWRTCENTRQALAPFIAQLVVNALWSWLFFAWRLGALAFIDVLLLLVLIAATMRYFAKHSRLAAALLFPYILWVGFASALTWAVWRDNPNVL